MQEVFVRPRLAEWGTSPGGPTCLCVDAGCPDNVAVSFAAVRFRTRLARQELLEVPPFRFSRVDQRDIAPAPYANQGQGVRFRRHCLEQRARDEKESPPHSSEPPKRQTPPSAAL